MLDTFRRLADPRRWMAAIDVLAELLAGGVVIPPAAAAEEWSEEEEQAAKIVTIIQPDGDIQVKVDKSVIESTEAEHILATHMDQVTERIKLIHDALDQVMTIRVVFSLPAVATLIDAAATFLTEVREGDFFGALVGAFNWWLVAAAVAALVVATFAGSVLGFFVRRRLNAISVDLGAFEKKLYRREAVEAGLG